MSYESRIIIAYRYDRDFASEIMRFNLSCIEDRILSIFNRQVNFDYYTGDDIKITKDKYGKPLTYCDLGMLYKILVKNSENRRVDMLKRAIESIMLNPAWENDRNNLIAIHYGY